MEDQSLLAKSELSKLGIKDLFYKYVRFLPLFLISIAISLLVVFIYLRYTSPVYQATGTLIIRSEDNKQGNDRFEQFLVTSSNSIETEVEYIKSRPLMQRVVEALNLNFTYYALGDVKERNIYKDRPFTLEAYSIKDSTSSFSLKIVFFDNHSFKVNDGETLISVGQTFKNQHGVFRVVLHSARLNNQLEYRVLWEPTPAVTGSLVGGLTVVPKSAGTNIISIAQQAPNPHLAADIANQLMKEYQKATVEDKNIMTKQTLDFIAERLDTVSREVDRVTNRLLGYQNANNVYDLEMQSSALLSKIEETDKELNEQRIQLRVAEDIERYLRDKKNIFELVPSGLGLQDQTLNTLISAYNVKQLERKELLENAPPGNPAVQQKSEEIEALRRNVIENLQNIKSTFRSGINNLLSKSASVQSEIKLLPPKQQNLIEIKRDQESKLAVKNYLMEKREESAISLAATISNIKVLDQAGPNYNPVKPRPENAKILAFAIGLVLPALFIFVLEIMDDKVNTRYDIEKVTTASIIGELGHSFKDDKLVVTQNNRSVLAEQFRIIRSNLQYVMPTDKKPVFLITSSFSGEGKSFISINMGVVLALSGKKTIVLEFDIRKPKILSGFSMPKKPGLTNYLLGKATLDELPVPVPGIEDLYVLPCGPVPPNPGELLLDPRLKDLFAFLREKFDVVVMDTAPVGMVSDAMTLGQYADAALYVVRQGFTYKKQIGLLDELHKEKKLPRVSVILNDVKVRAGYGYYGYGRYGYGKGYGYGYGSGYFDDEKKPTFTEKWFGFLNLNGKKKKKVVA
jgi:capsular exopolysaccharide synthesis family protein